MVEIDSGSGRVDYSCELKMFGLDGRLNDGLVDVLGYAYSMKFSPNIEYDNFDSFEKILPIVDQFVNSCYNKSNRPPARISLIRFKNGRLVLMVKDLNL